MLNTMSRILAYILCCCVVVQLAQGGDSDKLPENPFSYESVYKQLTHLEIDNEKVLDCRQFSFRRDVATFNFVDGYLYFCKPVNGRVCAAVFKGHGTFSFSPPTKIEKDQLKRYYKTDSLTQSFIRLFLVFADSTYEEFSSRGKLTGGDVLPEAQTALALCMKYLGDAKKGEIEPELIKPFISNTRNGLFFSQFYENDTKPLFFEINPDEVEEIRFMRQLETQPFLYRWEVVNQFQQQQDFRNQVDLNYKNKDEFGVSRYTIDCTIEKDIGLRIRSECNIITYKNINTMLFYLGSELIVDSVVQGNGSPVRFFKGEESPYLWIQRDKAFAEGEEIALRFTYHGKAFFQWSNYFYLPTSAFWYPTVPYNIRSNFDITYHYPSGATLVSVGDSISSVTQEKVTTSHWVTTAPARWATFHLGNFDRLDIPGDSIPPITILVTWENKERLIETGVEYINSIRFFQKIFGKPALKRLYATNMPGSGIACPGLIYTSKEIGSRRMSGSVPYGNWMDEADLLTLSSKIANQWWSVGVDIKTYHDRWLSEGFALYSGLSYLQSRVGNNENFLNYLREWKRRMLESNVFLLGDREESGPIWMGYRTLRVNREEDFALQVYQKGAWVLHMLRNMLRDPVTMSDTGFVNLMQDYYRTYEGKAASTDDFMNIVSAHMGMDMSWFFRQWVYESAIPKYEYCYHSKDTAGQYKVTMRVRQSNVPDDFQMFIPLKVDFGGGRVTRLSILVTGREMEFDLPLFSYKPVDVVFNDLESVLCEVEKVYWK